MVGLIKGRNLNNTVSLLDKIHALFQKVNVLIKRFVKILLIHFTGLGGIVQVIETHENA